MRAMPSPAGGSPASKPCRKTVMKSRRGAWPMRTGRRSGKQPARRVQSPQDRDRPRACCWSSSAHWACAPSTANSSHRCASNWSRAAPCSTARKSWRPWASWRPGWRTRFAIRSPPSRRWLYHPSPEAPGKRLAGTMRHADLISNEITRLERIVRDFLPLRQPRRSKLGRHFRPAPCSARSARIAGP